MVHQYVLGKDDWETLPLGQVSPKGPTLSSYIKHLQCIYSSTSKSFHGKDKSIRLYNRVKTLKTLSVLKFQEKEVEIISLFEQNMPFQPLQREFFVLLIS